MTASTALRAHVHEASESGLGELSKAVDNLEALPVAQPNEEDFHGTIDVEY
jgi:hypothetical protein